MAMAVSNLLLCPSLQIHQRNRRLQVSAASNFSPPFLRFSRTIPRYQSLIRAAASAAGSSYPDNNMDPYEVLGVSPIAGFDKIRLTYTKKRREAEKSGDETTAARLEKAYDKIMTAELKGVTSGSFKVSKDVRYADSQPIVSWAPRLSKSSAKDVQINLAISAVFTIWVILSRGAEYKPMQFLVFTYVYRLFEKLKALEPATSPTISEDGGDNARTIRMGKRLFRSLALASSCVVLSSLLYTVYLNAMDYLSLALINNLNQERFITILSAVFLYILGSYYR